MSIEDIAREAAKKAILESFRKAEEKGAFDREVSALDKWHERKGMTTHFEVAQLIATLVALAPEQHKKQVRGTAMRISELSWKAGAETATEEWAGMVRKTGSN